MSDVTDQTPDIEALKEAQGHSTDPDYLAWKEAKIKRAIERKKSGSATYKSIEEVAEKFGFNAD